MNEEVNIIFKYNAFVLNKNLADISHEESVAAPQAGGNPINWVLGHIIVTRDSLFEALGADSMCDEKMTETYVQGSKQLDPKDATDINKLLELFNQSQEKLKNILQSKDLKDDPEKSAEVAGFGFHEAYHVGQTGILRRLLGKEGTIK